MVLLFTHQNSQRVHYIFNVVLFARLGVTFQITSDWSFFVSHKSPIKIVYTDRKPVESDSENWIWVYNAGLLHENFVREMSQEISKKTLTFRPFREDSQTLTLPFANIEALFISPELTDNQQYLSNEPVFCQKNIPFDIFSEIFWCLTRYEEYQWDQIISKTKEGNSFQNNTSTNPTNEKVYSADQHGRYPAKQSLLFQNGWLEIPIVDKLIWLLGYCINQTPQDQFEIIATADIDMALRYRGRKFYVQFGSLIKDVFTRPILILERLKSLIKNEDPYQIDLATLPILIETENPKIFLLNHQKRTNRNKQILSHLLKKEIDRCKQHFTLNSNFWGMHPSWQDLSNEITSKTAWAWEKSEFENMITSPALHARLHYIHLRLPYAYRILQQIGISHDWSMGYPDAIGFRAGTSKPFVWYDLGLEKCTGLTIHPFCIMDVTCKNYLNLSYEISTSKANHLKQMLQSLGGTFCFIFHNESVSNSFPWRGWKNTIIEWTKKPNNHLD